MHTDGEGDTTGVNTDRCTFDARMRSSDFPENVMGLVDRLAADILPDMVPVSLRPLGDMLSAFPVTSGTPAARGDKRAVASARSISTNLSFFKKK